MYAKIIQICPAQPGTYAVYEGEDDKKEVWVPLSCWALVSESVGEGEFTFVSGVEVLGHGATGEVCSETSNFLRFDVEAYHPDHTL